MTQNENNKISALHDLADGELLDRAQAAGFVKSDPLWPVIEGTEAVRQVNQKFVRAVEAFDQRFATNTRAAIEAQNRRLELQTDNLNAVARDTVSKSLQEMSAELAQVAHNGWTRQARLVERKTIIGAIISGALLALVAYSIGSFHEYDRGYATAQAEGSAQISALKSRENAVERLFRDRPGELEKWLPIIERNPLSTSDALETCRRGHRFYFDNDRSKEGCWLPIWIGIEPDQRGAHTIPGPVPNSAPPGVSPEGLY